MIGPDGAFSAYNQNQNIVFRPKRNNSKRNMDDKEFFEKLATAELPEEEIKPKLTMANSKIKEAEKIEINGEDEKKEEKEKEEELEIFEGPEGQLTVDVYQTPTSFIIESTVAGVKGEDLDVAVSPDAVIVRGKRVKEERVVEKDYLCQECFWGRFSRTVILPEEIDPDKSHATLKNGVLKVVLPKINRQKSKKIKVKFD